MKPPVRYGLMIAVGMMAWVIVAHLLVPNPKSLVHSFGVVTFSNLLHFAGIYLALKATERERRDKLAFKEGIKIGVTTSFIYAITVSLFFVGVLLIVGTKWVEAEGSAPDMPIWLVAARAFAGLFVVSMFFGLVYSTLISFVLAKRKSDDQ